MKHRHGLWLFRLLRHNMFSELGPGCAIFCLNSSQQARFFLTLRIKNIYNESLCSICRENRKTSTPQSSIKPQIQLSFRNAALLSNFYVFGKSNKILPTLYKRCVILPECRAIPPGREKIINNSLKKIKVRLSYKNSANPTCLQNG